MPVSIVALNAPVAELGECPVWAADQGVLFWVDIDGRLVIRYDPSTKRAEQRALSGRPGAIATTADPNRLLVACEHELLWLDWVTGQTERFVELEEPGTGNRLNDGRCDPAGRFIVGSMFADTSAGRHTGQLHGINDTRRASVLRASIGVTNGLAFDSSRSRMYFADTPTEQVLVFDYDVTSGELANERVFFDYSSVEGKPDGACVDADGCYWSASVYGWALTRITPEGVVDRRIDLPVQKPSMPCFGGPNLDVLYVTTIGAGGTVPSEPGRDGIAPGSTLEITGLGIQGVAEPIFGS